MRRGALGWASAQFALKCHGGLRQVAGQRQVDPAQLQGLRCGTAHGRRQREIKLRCGHRRFDLEGVFACSCARASGVAVGTAGGGRCRCRCGGCGSSLQLLHSRFPAPFPLRIDAGRALGGCALQRALQVSAHKRQGGQPTLCALNVEPPPLHFARTGSRCHLPFKSTAGARHCQRQLSLHRRYTEVDAQASSLDTRLLSLEHQPIQHQCACSLIVVCVALAACVACAVFGRSLPPPPCCQGMDAQSAVARSTGRGGTTGSADVCFKPHCTPLHGSRDAA